MNAQTEEWSLWISIIFQDTLLVGALSDELIKEYFWIEQKMYWSGDAAVLRFPDK